MHYNNDPINDSAGATNGAGELNAVELETIAEQAGLSLESYISAHPEHTKFYLVPDDALLDSGIRPRDLIAVDESSENLPGDLVLAHCPKQGFITRLFLPPFLASQDRSGKHPVYRVEDAIIIGRVVASVQLWRRPVVA